jgi:hypothetical protein
MKQLIQLRGFCGIALLAVSLIGCSESDGAVKEATLPELNRALVAWRTMNSGPPPAEVSGLTNSPALRGKRLPSPPAGKKFVIDPVRREIVLVDQ